MMYLNQTYKKMITVMIFMLIGGGIFMLFNHQKNNIQPRVPTTMVLYGLDQDTNIDILYRTPNQIFESNKTISSDNKTIISTPKLFLDMTQKILVPYIISTNLTDAQKNVKTISLSTQEELEISGFTPSLPVSVIQNNKALYRDIPTDWAGRLVLNLQEENALLPLCLSWESVRLCYSDKDSVKGGVS